MGSKENFTATATSLQVDVTTYQKSSGRNLARHFCEETTAHGFGSFIRQRNLLGKLCWALIIATATAASCFTLTRVVLNFLEYKTQEIVTLSYDPPPFPDVTVCNLHAVSRRAMEDPENLHIIQSFESTVSDITEAANVLDMDQHVVEKRAISSYSFLENAGLAASRKVGHQQRNLILRCTFAGSLCRQENFAHFTDPTYYNCFTFRPNSTVSNKPTPIGAGPAVGLSIIVYLEVKKASSIEVTQRVYNEYSPIHNALGAKVVIHEKGTLPLAVDFGLDVMPGQSTSFRVSTEEYVRLDKPYGDCITEKALPGLEDFAYSPSGCLHLCIQRYVWNQCGCVSSYFSVPDDLSDHHFCGTFNNSDPAGYFRKVDCEQSKWLDFVSNSSARGQCQCHSSCHRYSYEVLSSQSQWPADEFVEDFYHDVVMPTEGGARDDLQNITSTNTTYFAGLVRANFARINVYFKTLSIEKRVQEPSFGLFSLLSSMGGTVGLWGGVSIITIAEMILFGLKLLFNCCVKLINK